MGNEIFELVVAELEEYMGDIWSAGIVKKGLKMIGATPSDVTEEEMRDALRKHVIPAAGSFVSRDKASQIHRQIVKKIDAIVESEVE